MEKHLVIERKWFISGVNPCEQPRIFGHRIVGVRDAFSPHAVLELISVGVGEVRIRSVETGLFLSMGSDGKVRAESSADSEETVFIENVSGPYLTYLR